MIIDQHSRASGLPEYRVYRARMPNCVHCYGRGGGGSIANDTRIRSELDMG
jgi:hypothetical protein